MHPQKWIKQQEKERLAARQPQGLSAKKQERIVLEILASAGKAHAIDIATEYSFRKEVIAENETLWSNIHFDSETIHVVLKILRRLEENNLVTKEAESVEDEQIYYYSIKSARDIVVSRKK